MIPEESKKDDSALKPIKIKERKSSFTSTCKSTSHSHQENIPNMTSVHGEEAKHELTFMRENTGMGGIYLDSKIQIKLARSRQLEIQSKVREPLSVRKIERNNEDLCPNIKRSKNSTIQFDSMPFSQLTSNIMNSTSPSKSE